MKLSAYRKYLGVVVGVGAITFGVVGPAFAEGTVHREFTRWTTGSKTVTWTDRNTDSVSTHVTYYDGCSKNFIGRIRRENFGPDTTVGSELINCNDYADAVYAGDVAADQYHGDVYDVGTSYINGEYQAYW